MNTKEFFKKEWLSLIILTLPFAIIAIFWGQFPEKVPFHWNFAGEVDDYASKELGLFIGPILNIFFYVLFFVLPKIDPRGNNYQFFHGTYKALRLGILTFLLLLFLIVAFISLGYDLNVGFIVIYLTIMLFLVIGNFMSKFRSNYFVGIRTPWTLENPEIWRKTHRLGGILWVWFSLVMLIVGLFVSMQAFTILYFIYLGIIVLIPIAYSYLLYLKEKKEN